MLVKFKHNVILIVAVVIAFFTIIHLFVLSPHLQPFQRIQSAVESWKSSNRPSSPPSHPKPAYPSSSPIHPSETPQPPTDIPEPIPDTVTSESNITLPLHQWLQHRGMLPGKHIPIITIADSSYTRSLRSFQRRLDTWKYGKQMVVLCLDQICADDPGLFNAYPGYIQSNENVMHAVGGVKFMMNIALAENGYDFVFFDGDVYLTGFKDPFSEMLPLSDTSWDIQFQPDNALDHWGDHYNIGWYFARATPATQEYFRTAFVRWISKETHPVDQNTMNEVVREMIPGHKDFKNGTELKVHLLDASKFRNFMNDQWDWRYFGNDAATSNYIKSSTIIHFTCIQHSLKEFFGLNFGGYPDMDGYYSDPSRLLRVQNISGTSDAIGKQVAFALELAKETNRITIWPDSVDIFERPHENPHFGYRAKLPGVVVVDYVKAKKEGYKVVEGRYLQNRLLMGYEPMTEQEIALNDTVEAGSVPELQSLVDKIAEDTVVVLDFYAVGTDWDLIKPAGEIKQPNFTELVTAAEAKFHEAFEVSGMTTYAATVWKQVPTCGRANIGVSCLQIC